MLYITIIPARFLRNMQLRSALYWPNRGAWSRCRSWYCRGSSARRAIGPVTEATPVPVQVQVAVRVQDVQDRLHRSTTTSFRVVGRATHATCCPSEQHQDGRPSTIYPRLSASPAEFRKTQTPARSILVSDPSCRYWPFRRIARAYI